MIRIESRTYTGTAAAQEVLMGAGPDFALTKRLNGAATNAYALWRGMPRNLANVPGASQASKANQIVDLTRDGIYVGSGQSQSAALYAAVTIKGLRGSKHFATGRFSTNNVDNRAMAGREGCGFQPDLLWMQRRTDGAALAAFRHRDHVGDQSQTFAAAATSNLIQSFTADGFTLGNSPTVNGSAADLVDWWALRNVPGAIHCTSFVGTGAAQDIALPFQPTVVLLKNRDTADPAFLLTQGMLDSAIASHPITAAAADATGITGIGAAGFSVGALAACNGAGNTILVVALRDGTFYPGRA